MTLRLAISFLCLLGFWQPTKAANDIMGMLSSHQNLTTFSNYLTQANLVNDINSRQPVTVLAVANSEMGSLAGQPMERVKAALSAHILLDYIDLDKLKAMIGKTVTVTTLGQTNGAQGGSVNITIGPSGIVSFGVNAMPLAELVQPLEAHPYNISVLQVNAPIIVTSVAPAPTTQAPAGVPTTLGNPGWGEYGPSLPPLPSWLAPQASFLLPPAASGAPTPSMAPGGAPSSSAGSVATPRDLIGGIVLSLIVGRIV